MSLPAQFGVPSSEVATLQLPRNARQFLAGLTADHTPPFDQLPEGNRQRALLREVLVLRVQQIADIMSVSPTQAVLRLIARIEAGAESAPVVSAARGLVRASSGKACPNRASLLRWFGDYDKHGRAGLADQHKGKQRQWFGWEPIVLHMWLTPGQQNAGAISFWLLAAGYDTATYARVLAFTKTFPESLGKYAKERIGKHYHQQNCTPYRMLDWSNVPVGYMYEADGHAVDWYTAHPITGKPVRLELVVWIDKRSHYVAGWLLWDRESALSTLFSLSRAMILHDHVPAVVHIDQGSGFKNKLMTREAVGFFEKFSIDPKFAIAGNARGKGLIEGFFKHFEARLGKTFDTYCGHDRTDDSLRRLESQLKKGAVRMPSFQDSLNAVTVYMTAFNNAPQKSLGNLSPRQLWERDLVRTPLHTPAEAVMRMSIQRTVSKNWRISLSNRTFQDGVLADYRSRQMIVEFDPFDWSQVWVYDMKRRFICIARQVDATPGMPDSHIADKEQARAEDAVARLEAHAEEARARAGLSITHDQRLPDIEALVEGQLFPHLEKTKAGIAVPAIEDTEVLANIKIDIYDTDY
jgi:putative transposase